MFENKDEEITYWQKRAEEIEAELEEFRESSQMIENELEASLEQAEKANRDLRLKNNRLQLDHDTIKDKLEQVQLEYSSQITELQEETTQCRSREEKYVKYLRELEQKNDDLERGQRAMIMSLEELEMKLNSTLERNVLLESELDEKDQLKTMVQRLKDEARDLKQEVNVRERERPDELIRPTGRKSSIKNIDMNKISSSPPLTPLRTVVKSVPVGAQSIPMSPTARLSAMNIVGDLLRKVGSLESKLASCRNVNRDLAVPKVPRDSTQS